MPTPDPSGEGRTPTRDLHAFLRSEPRAGGVRTYAALLADRRAAEDEAEDFLSRRSAGLGRADTMDRYTRDGTTSEARYREATIVATTAINEHELARIRNRRGSIASDGGSMHASAWLIAVTDEARHLIGADAGLRLADLAAHHDAPTYDVLDAPREAEARATCQRSRAHDAIVGELVRNEFDGSTMALLDRDTLRLLIDHELVTITALEDLYSAAELEGRENLGRRMRGLTTALRGWKRELDSVTAFLLSLAALTGAAIGLLRLLGLL